MKIIRFPALRIRLARVAGWHSDRCGFGLA
jgi:hypothetical protein